VFPGYWRDTEATARALGTDGWLRVGDVAVEGDDGELYIVERLKDLVNVSGFNVYPAEVEEVLRAHPAVADAAAVGTSDERTGGSVHAFVVISGDAAPPAPSELTGFCRARLAGYKVPTGVTFVTSLPYGLGGKLLRRRLVVGL
jgi:long-chain acyl-CoA synthetase